jgi:hypothetical protein
MNTSSSVEVLVVDDDTAANAGVVETVSEALGVRLRVNIHGSRSNRRRL